VAGGRRAALGREPVGACACDVRLEVAAVKIDDDEVRIDAALELHVAGDRVGVGSARTDRGDRRAYVRAPGADELVDLIVTTERSHDQKQPGAVSRNRQ